MKVIFSKKSDATLKNIYQYIFSQSENEQIAKKTIDEIIQGTQILITAPKIGRVLKSENIRFLVIGKFVAVYKIRNNDILITEIYKAGQNWR